MLHAEQKTKTDNTNIFSLPAFRQTLSVSPDGAPGHHDATMSAKPFVDCK